MVQPPDAVPPRPTLRGWWALGLPGLCLLAGVTLGRWLPPAPAPVWTGRSVERGASTVDGGSTASPATAALPTTFAPAVERVSPAVVAVSALLAGGDDQPQPTAPGQRRSEGVRAGSGFVVHRTGLVVTARHLTVDAERILVRVPQLGTFDAELVGADDVTDLAVLRLEAPPRNLPVLELGQSENLRAGDWIVAVGNPYGFTQTVTAGIVSFVGRHLRQDDQPVSSDFVQFSAAVNPGSSGCPVVDLDGRVVGVTTQAADAAQGISFAIPSRTLKWVLDAMNGSRDGRVHRGYLGIKLDPRSGSDDYGRPLEGAIVREVATEAPAQRAGLQCGDIVLLYDDHQVVDPGDLHDRITRSVPGSEVRLTLLRGGRVLDPVLARLGDAATPSDGELYH